jgi:hypothetical protein
VSGFVPAVTLTIGAATDNAWWHPAIVLAGLALITLVATLQAGRMALSNKEPAYARTGA